MEPNASCLAVFFHSRRQTLANSFMYDRGLKPMLLLLILQCFFCEMSQTTRLCFSLKKVLYYFYTTLQPATVFACCHYNDTCWDDIIYQLVHCLQQWSIINDNSNNTWTYNVITSHGRCLSYLQMSTVHFHFSGSTSKILFIFFFYLFYFTLFFI